MTVKWLAVLIVVCGAAAPAQFRPRPWFTPSAAHLEQAVLKALMHRGVEIGTGQVSLLSNIVATDENPALDVRSIAALDNRLAGEIDSRSAVKLVCHEPGACLPFYAIVFWTTRPAKYAAAFPSASVADIIKKPAVPNLMQAGVHATLVMKDDRANIEMSVISLESGPAGRTIRVQSSDRKRIYSAEIVSANVVKGSF
jgi:hypothetical protein